MEGIDLISETIENDTISEWPIPQLNDFIINATTSEDNSTKWMDEAKNLLDGKVLRVTYLEDYPLSYSDGNSTMKGVAFELLEFLMEKFNFTYEIVRPNKNIFGSTTDREGSILEVLANDSADIAVSFLPILSDARDQIYYSTTTLDEGEFMMLMLRPSESATGSGLLAPFEMEVWILILVSLVLVGPIIYFLLVLRMKLTKDKDQQIYSLPHCIWFVYGALMKQGSTLSPLGDSTRLLFATWWIFITILTSFYTANLTAFLTLSKFTLPINTVEDISKKQKSFVAHRGSGVEYVIKNNNESLTFLSVLVQKNLATFTEKLNDSEIATTDVEKMNKVFVRDKPAISHLIYNDYKQRKKLSVDNEKIHCPFAVAKTPFLKRRRTFAYPNNSPYQRLFDNELLHMVESGIVKYKLLQDLPNAEICPNNLGGTERQLKNGDLIMTYYVMIAGFCTSVAVFVSELFFRYLNHRKAHEKKTPQLIKMTKQPKSLATITPPPPYGSLFNNARFLTGSDVLYGINRDMNIRSREIENKMQNENKFHQYYNKKTGLLHVNQPVSPVLQYSYTN